jgi:alanyl-tRNA synthetase
MQTAEIRRRFLAHFEKNGHTLVPSAPLPFQDPNLLFVNAGMVPFVPYFSGQQTAPYDRATSVQKCLRTLDIEEVGKTSRHGTFFQMCGNFSFGDYFKREAITFAWTLITGSVDDGGFGLDPERIWPTVYHDDDESRRLWKEITGLPDERIQARGMKDNFWSMGIPGPCGPCSEIFYDRGPQYGADGGPVVDEDRFVEIWNLVFMQNLRGPGGGKEDYEILGELPAKNIDTGMGLERVAYILQGKDNLYEIDEVFGVIERASQLSGRRYGDDHDDDVLFRVVADHVRSGLMLIGDGVTPGNEGRGYVLRRLLRRAVRSMRLLGVEERTLPELLPVSMQVMKESYPELERDWDRIATIAYAEEDAFRQTLRTGTLIFDQAAAETKAGGSTRLAGDKAFALHDTYGFPIDLTLEMAAEQGLEVDEAEFRRLMGEQRSRAKADSQAKRGQHADTAAYRQVQDSLTGSLVAFTGYDQVADEGVVRGLVSGTRGLVQVATEGDEVDIILDTTPFYAESGGQLADHGLIELADGTVAQVLDVQKPIAGLIAHRARILSGELQVGASAVARVDVDRRRSICRAHTATHMVHKAIREALGDTATQAGSENAPGRLRFDFSAGGAVPAATMAAVEERINELVVDDLAVDAEVMNIDDALRSGAMALFGEKYGDEVRVVSVGGDWSRELCGGTHAQRSGQLGIVKLLGESSIGAGKRRVEALVGTDAYRFLASEHLLVSQLAETLNVRSAELPDRIGDIVARLRSAEKEIEQVRVAQLLASAGQVADGARDLGGVAFVGHRAPDGAGAADVRRLALDVRHRLGDRPSVVAVIGSADGRPSVVVALSDEARARGLSANDLVKVAAGALGGKGGGKDDVAQGGGADPTAIEDALVQVERAVAARAGV